VLHTLLLFLLLLLHFFLLLLLLLQLNPKLGKSGDSGLLLNPKP
jgi:hypothetical protein